MMAQRARLSEEHRCCPDADEVAERALRKAADHGFFAFIGLVVTAVSIALWSWISAHLKG